MSFTNERNILIVIALMKAHNIKKIVISPGATNVNFVASVQQDPWFELYSAADERSAGYIACGLAEASDEPVALSCTGATSSRNYMPALTEAFYRNLPVLAITSTVSENRIGMNIPQVIDRRVVPNDIVKLSVNIPTIHTEEDVWGCTVRANQAMLELRRRGGGPAHINLATVFSKNFSVAALPNVRVIKRISYNDQFPVLEGGKIGILVGAHKPWDSRLLEAVDAFCKKYNAVVFCDHTSNSHGNFQVYGSRLSAQTNYLSPCLMIDTLIHLGDISGASMLLRPRTVWRVHPDGELRDFFRKLNFAFEMNEIDFFRHYLSDSTSQETAGPAFLQELRKEESAIYKGKPNLPFSNLYVAGEISNRLPEGSLLYLAILNSLRCWNFYDIPKSIECYSNTGGFGIDGTLSSLLGTSLVNKNRLCFCVLGDLGFFYDMNSLGNRYLGKNIRILLINNGGGIEFKIFNHQASSITGMIDPYVAAMGHYGNKSRDIVKHYAQDLGFEYLSASNKEEFATVVNDFLNPNITNKPILFEVFTDATDESNALKAMCGLKTSISGLAKALVSKKAGKNRIDFLKKIIKW